MTLRSQWQRQAPLWSGAAIIFFALVAYANSFPGAFILDDHSIAEINPLVANFDLIAIFRTEYWGRNLATGLYRPLTILSLAVNQLVLGSAAWTFHLVNLLLHALVALLVYVALRRWTIPETVAFLTAAIFAVHPIHTEVVNEVVGRSELLAALFMLLAISCAANKGSRKSLILTAGCFTLALLAKEHAITLLVIIPLLDAFFARSWRAWQERWKLYATLGVVVIVWWFWKEFGVLHTGRPEVVHPIYAPLRHVDWIQRLLAAIALQWLYLGKLLLPLRLQAVYSGAHFFSANLLALSWATLLSGAGLLCAAVLCVVGVRRWQLLAFSFLLYVVALVPTSNILLPISVNFAERLLYFPSIWFSLLISAALVGGLRLIREERLFAAALTLYPLFLFVLCLLRNPAYGDENRLWRTDVQTDPQNVVAWLYLGESLRSSGDLQESDRAFRQMLTIAPDFSVGQRNYAALLIETGRAKEGIELALQAVKDPSNDLETTKLILAGGYLQVKDYEQTLFWLDQIATFYQGLDDYWELRGRAYQGLGRYAEAVAAYEHVQGWPPGSDGPLYFGLSLFQVGRMDEAERMLRAGLQERNDPAGWNALGVILAQKGQLVDALELFKRAVELAPQNQFYRNNLDRALKSLNQ